MEKINPVDKAKDLITQWQKADTIGEKQDIEYKAFGLLPGILIALAAERRENAILMEAFVSSRIELLEQQKGAFATSEEIQECWNELEELLKEIW